MLDYKMITYTIETVDGIEYISEYPALAGVLGTGSTDIDSISDLKENAKVHLDFMNEMDIEIPIENEKFDVTEFSGKISYRP